MIKVYGYKKWVTVQKSLKFLRSNGFEIEFFDMVTSQLDEKVLKELIERSGVNIDEFFSVRGRVFKELELKDKLPTLSEEEKFSLLLSDGKLIKRPIIDFGTRIFIGFNEKNLLEYINEIKLWLH